MMMLGFVLAGLGLLFLVATITQRFGFFHTYHSRHTGLTLLGVVLLLVGLALVIFQAYSNGQLG